MRSDVRVGLARGEVQLGLGSLGRGLAVVLVALEAAEAEGLGRGFGLGFVRGGRRGQRGFGGRRRCRFGLAKCLPVFISFVRFLCDPNQSQSCTGATISHLSRLCQRRSVKRAVERHEIIRKQSHRGLPDRRRQKKQKNNLSPEPLPPGCRSSSRQSRFLPHSRFAEHRSRCLGEEPRQAGHRSVVQRKREEREGEREEKEKRKRVLGERVSEREKNYFPHNI